MSLTRDPRGKFIWQPNALHSWLPTLLATACGDCLETLLLGGMRFCEMEAARALLVSAKHIEDPSVQLSEAEGLYWWGVKQAEKAGKRRAILLKALRELREIK